MCTQYDEWGNPQKPEFYDYMKSYSPVDNICRTGYPNILVTAGECCSPVFLCEDFLSMLCVRQGVVGQCAHLRFFLASGLHDPRVGYWEPAKFVAKLREHKTDENMLIFKCDMGAGAILLPGVGMTLQC